MKLWVATTPVDKRKSFDILAAVVEKSLRHALVSGCLFEFRYKGAPD
ncbi:IS66 family insertion sequence element accessory protein TnpB [Aeoliella mucimassa]|nr:IS66 family insertion sequence element accessory protein TnpB [Aeoliella mucimassa]